jgi:hypothetical protein
MDALKVIVPYVRTLHVVGARRLRSEGSVQDDEDTVGYHEVGSAGLIQLLVQLIPLNPFRLIGLDMTTAFITSWEHGLDSDTTAQPLLDQIRSIHLNDILLKSYQNFSDFMDSFPLANIVVMHSISLVNQWDDMSSLTPCLHQLASWSWISPALGRYSYLASGLPWICFSRSAHSIRELRVSIQCSQDTTMLAPFLCSALLLDLLELSLERMEEPGLRDCES